MCLLFINSHSGQHRRRCGGVAGRWLIWLAARKQHPVGQRKRASTGTVLQKQI